MKTIQKTLFAALCCTMALTTQAQERTFQRNKVLIEKHTGQGCVNCPSAETVLEKYLSTTSNTDNVVIMRHHNYGGAPLYYSATNRLLTIWGIRSHPRLQADRYSFADDKSNADSHHFAASSFSSNAIVDTRMHTPTYVSLSLEGSSFDPVTRKLRVTLSGEVTKALPDLRINVFITQSGIQSYQSGGTSPYIHDDATCDFLMNDVEGDAFTVNADGSYSVTFEKVVPAAYRPFNTDFPMVAEKTKVVAFVSSSYDEKTNDYSACEVHNVDVVRLADLPKVAPCAMPTIELKDGSFVCKSTTPKAVCQYEVKPLMQPIAEVEGTIDLEAPAFVVTAYAVAEGFTTSERVSRTFSLRDVLGADVSDVRDVDGNGLIDKADIDALLGKLLRG